MSRRVPFGWPEWPDGRSRLEAFSVVAATLPCALGIGLLGSIAVKFQLALALGMIGLLVLLLVPARRTLCLFLWVVIEPLSIEKIVYTARPWWNDLRGQEIIINGGDVMLMLLALVLVLERPPAGGRRLVWDPVASACAALAAWAVATWLIHLGWFHDPYINASPIGILILLRTLAMVLIVNAALRTRADLIWVLLGILAVVLLESVLVGLSYLTGEAFNFARLLGVPSPVQTYSGEGGALVRASGTLGVANQQALFHATFTLLIVGLLAARNDWIRYLALAALLASGTAVILTFARAAWLCLALAVPLIFFVFLARREVSPRAWLTGGLLAMVFAAALAVLAQPVLDRLTKGDDGSTDSRVRMIALATDLFLAHPLIGVGPSEYVEAGLNLYPPGEKVPEWVALGERPIVAPLGRIELARAVLPGQRDIVVPLAVHNKYLLVLAELGVVGLCLWLWMLWSFLQAARRCARSSDRLLRYTGIAGLGVVLVVVVYTSLDLFADDKTLQILLFPLLVVSGAERIARGSARIPQAV